MNLNQLKVKQKTVRIRVKSKTSCLKPPDQQEEVLLLHARSLQDKGWWWWKI